LFAAIFDLPRGGRSGMTPHEIMAITGLKSLHLVMHYAGAFDRKKLAASGMAKIEART
jgi:hypothetical protein